MNNNAIRGLWLAWALLLSTIIAVAAGMLTYLAGKHLAEAVITSGAAFGATATLLVIILTFITPPNAK
jgi:hypothetical protein